MGIAQRLTARFTPQVWPRLASATWETEHRLFHALGRSRAPAAVQWMVTQACDLHCRHCYAEAGRRAPGELSTAEAKALVIDAAADMGCPLLVLSGGELWLRRDIEELIEHAVGRGMDWAMHTHGAHVAKHRALLRRCPPALAAISFDGDEARHDDLRGKPGSHAAALAAVAELRDAGCGEIVLGTTITAQNADYVADMFELVVGSGAHSWGLHLVAPEGRAALELLPTPAQLRRVAAFARSRRARFPVELCNEWGSAGADDAHYRDRPFSCGAGRISMVVTPTGEVAPCTTLDPRESEGNVRDAALAEIWRDGFARFRDGVDPSCSTGSECWLQSRNGVAIAHDAFGPVARRAPSLVDYVPGPLVSLTRRALGPSASPRVASVGTHRAIRAAAVGLAFIGACTLREEPQDPTTKLEPEAEPGSEAEAEAPQGTVAATIDAPQGWPASLDADGVRAWSSWSSMHSAAGRGSWKAIVLPQLLAWEAGGPAPDLGQLETVGGARASARFTRELGRYVGRGVGKSSLADLLELLDAAEAAALFDASLAAHLWRAAEAIPQPKAPDRASLEQRASLYARLARHHHVVLALVTTTASLGSLEQRPWLKKSAPPPGWNAQPQDPKAFLDAARGQFDAGPSGPWDTVGCSIVPTGEAAVVRYREGQPTTLAAGRSHRLTRLDVLEVRGPVSLALGELELRTTGDAILSHASLAALLDADANAEASARVDALIDRALANDEAAIVELEPLLPLARNRVRAKLGAANEGPGAPALRTLLVGYEE